MAQGMASTLLRLAKPFAVGLGLAFLVTAFVDKPTPVHFQPENPYAAEQSEIVEPQAELVMDKNVLKLGSPLSVRTESEGSPVVSGEVGEADAIPLEADNASVTGGEVPQ